MRQRSEDNHHISISPAEQNKNKHARMYSKYYSNWITGILSSLSLLTNSSQTSLAPQSSWQMFRYRYCNNLSDNPASR